MPRRVSQANQFDAYGNGIALESDEEELDSPGQPTSNVHVSEHRRSITEEILGTSALGYDSIEKGDGEIKGEVTEVLPPRGQIAKKKEPKTMPPKDAPFRSTVRVRRQSRESEIDLQGQKLGDADADAITTVMRETKLTKLLLANNELGDEAAKKIAATLAENTTLVSLSLHNNRITSEGGHAFATALGKNTTLTSLYLSSTDLGNEAEEAIAMANALRPNPMKGLGGLVIGGAASFANPTGPLRSPRVSREI